MTLEQARDILGISKDDSIRKIKSRFHTLMRKYHPDTIAEDNADFHQKAQILNEAYSILRGKKIADLGDAEKRNVWKDTVLPDAYTERSIYSVLWEDEVTQFIEVARGKYAWDPELEDFKCLLRSLNQVAVELLEEVEEQSQIWMEDEETIKEQRFVYQVQIFHLLARQFIRPVDCLGKLSYPIEVDEEGRNIYRFSVLLGAKEKEEEYKAMEQLEEGEMLYLASIQDNRIMVCDSKENVLGHLSLEEDHWYYIIIPILQNHLAHIKLEVRKKEIKKKARPYQVQVHANMYLRMDDVEEPKGIVGNQNEMIRRILEEYKRNV